MEKESPKFTIEENILKGKEVSHKIVYTSLGKLVLDTLENNPDFVGQIEALTGEQYTYKKMRERSVRCALWMKSQGLLPGDHVAICSHHQLDVTMPCLAALYLGAVFNPLDAAMNAKEILHLLKIIKPKMAFVNGESATTIAEAARQAELDLKIVTFGRVTGFLEFESVIVEPEVNEVENFECAVIGNSEQTAIVICSSGTTGLPKGVALSHGAIINHLSQAKIFGLAGNNCLIFTPLCWLSGVFGIFWNMVSKVTRITTPSFNEVLACETVEKYQINWIFISSSMINRLLKSGLLEKYDLSCMKHVVYGGSPLALASRELFAKFVPNAVIASIYGITELGGALSLGTANSKPDSTGPIMENVQLKVIDPDTGRILGANEKGELLLKSNSMMSFYCDNPQATAEAVDEEGWFHSGDLGYYDEDGEIFVVDRLKELIKYLGHQVAPVEIESVILSHPGVKEVAVVGVPHPVEDEHPIAFVVRATDPNGADEQVTETELVDLVAAQLSNTNRLRAGVRFIDALPKTPSGKVRRKELRDLAKSAAKNGDDRCAKTC